MTDILLGLHLFVPNFCSQLLQKKRKKQTKRRTYVAMDAEVGFSNARDSAGKHQERGKNTRWKSGTAAAAAAVAVVLTVIGVAVARSTVSKVSTEIVPVQRRDLSDHEHSLGLGFRSQLNSSHWQSGFPKEDDGLNWVPLRRLNTGWKWTANFPHEIFGGSDILRLPDPATGGKLIRGELEVPKGVDKIRLKMRYWNLNVS